MLPLSIQDIARFLGKKSTSDATIEGVAADSRLVKNKELFFALPGERTDGHTFLQDVAAKGAYAAVVSSAYRGDSFGLELIAVDNVLQALQKLAKEAIDKHKPKIAAITGSLGKTTTKEFLSSILHEEHSVFATQGNANSQIGLPMAILNNRKKAEIYVLEMGMTHPGNLGSLIEIAPPDLALITSIAPVHLCNFSDLKHLAKCKGQLFSFGKTQLGIYCKDTPFAEELSQIGSCRKISFSTQKMDADYYLKSKLDRIQIFFHGKLIIEHFWSIHGNHNLHNYLAAFSAAHQLGVAPEKIAQVSQKLTLPERRLQRINQNGVLFINDAYNASIDSMIAAFESMPEAAGPGRRIGVLGDMVDYGEIAEDVHRQVGIKALSYFDLLFCIGKNCEPIVECWQKAGREVKFFQNRKDLVASLHEQLREGDLVLLKGSRPHQLDKVIEERAAIINQPS